MCFVERCEWAWQFSVVLLASKLLHTLGCCMETLSLDISGSSLGSRLPELSIFPSSPRSWIP